MNMNTELVARENTELAIPQDSWGAEGVDSKDILISKILLQQSLSKYVLEEKAKPGDMVDSVSGEVLGNKNKPIHIIPIMMTKSVVVEILKDGKYEFVREEPVQTFPEKLEYTTNEGSFRINKSLNFYVLLADKASEPDAFPMVLSFRRTSFMAGKALSTHFAKAQIGRYPPANKVFSVSTHKVENDKGTFYTFTDIKEVRKSEPIELQNAYNWYKTLKSVKVRVDETDDSEAIDPPNGASDIPF
jgi:hypothetical protein